MDKFKEIIENKKLKSNRKPRYGTRKLSIGLVSCVFGYAMLISPNVALADEANETETAVEESAIPTNTPAEESTEETEATTSVAEDTPNVENLPAEILEEESQATDSESQPTEEAATDVKKANEKVPEKKLVTLDEYNALQEENAEANADAEELEIPEEADPEALQAGETEAGRDISNEITEAEIHVGDTETDGVLNAGNGEGLSWSVAFKAPEGTKAGDYFDIVLSDNWTLKGIEPDTDKADPIDINGKMVADGKRLSRHQIRYTFNQNVEGLDEVRVLVQYGGYDVKEKVQNSKTQTFTVSVGNHSDSKELFVNYGQVRYDNYQRVLNGTSQYTYFNPDTGDFTQVFYINPDSRYIGHSTGDNFNGSVGVIVDNRGFDDQASQAYFTDENTRVEIVEVPQGTKMPDAVYENPVNGKTAQDINPVYDNGKICMDFGKNEINNSYIITVKSKIDPNVKKINLGSRATLYGNGTLDLGLVNQIQFETGNTGGSGVEETYSLGDRVWIDDNKDGIQTDGEKGVEGVTVTLKGGDLTEAKTTKTDANGNYKFEGLKNGDYTVTFEIPEGYEATKVDETKEDAENSDEIDSDAKPEEDRKTAKVSNAKINNADNLTVDFGLVKTKTPGKPSEPTTPTTPSEPGEPTVPSTPDEPNVPSTPEEPTLPSTPEEPEETSPLIPLTPADPVEEVKNNDDKEVEKPEENSEENQKTEVVEQTEDVKKEVIEQVKVPNRSKIENPKTGISSSLGLISTLAASAFAYLGLDDKKRKNK